MSFSSYKERTAENIFRLNSVKDYIRVSLCIARKRALKDYAQSSLQLSSATRAIGVPYADELFLKKNIFKNF